MILMKKTLMEFFAKKKCKKTNQNEFSIGKITQKKDDNFYVKWKGYNNSFSNWIDKKM